MAKSNKTTKSKKAPPNSTASTYISRTNAVKKLQISLATFRRLCILKGIYPREPNNKKKAGGGSTAPRTYYYRKDIQYLSHEPILAKLREIKTHNRKIKKALAKREFTTAKVLESHKPNYHLSLILKERYPSFQDALRDLDDALSTINLFATLKVDNAVIKPEDVAECQRLATEFNLYVIHNRLLRKVFISIKGVYYQAEIQGQAITWNVPHAFSQNTPFDVDFRVMATFLELYKSLVGFVNFKLFTDLGVIYPLTVDKNIDDKAGGLNGFTLSKKPLIIAGDEVYSIGNSNKNSFSNIDRGLKNSFRNQQPQLILPNIEDHETIDEEDSSNVQAVNNSNLVSESEDSLFANHFNENVAQEAHLTQLFSTIVFYINREVPRSLMEFVIKCFGGRVGWDETAGAGSPISIENTNITHHIVDRPLTSMNLNDRRVYVQPQWVFDCINAGKLLDSRLYQPGEILPPHLSPFVCHHEEAAANVNGSDSEDEDLVADDVNNAVSLETSQIAAEDSHQEEDVNTTMEEEEILVPTKSSKKHRKGKREEAKEEQKLDDLKATMLSKKNRYLYTRIVAAREKTRQDAVKLSKKRKALRKQNQLT